MVLHLHIPAWGTADIQQVLFDLNGTLARDGQLTSSTRDRLQALSASLNVYILSADTYDTLADITAGLSAKVQRVPAGPGAAHKRDFLMALGAATTIAVGNGRNDAAMLEAAILGIAILGPEGVASEALLAADLVFGSVDDALDALLMPRRLVATLRG